MARAIAAGRPSEGILNVGGWGEDIGGRLFVFV